MTLEEMRAEVLSDLIGELNSDESFNRALLESKVKNAFREVKAARKYPKTFTDEMIAEDMENYISNIYSLALYDYNRSGVEETSSYQGNGETRSYIERNKLFSGIIPIGGVV